VAQAVGRLPSHAGSLQKGFIVLARSTNPHHIAGNADVFDFALTGAQIAALDALDEGLTTDWDPETMA
jgi:diketogulonate reductase-like aldo/keto reductase